MRPGVEPLNVLPGGDQQLRGVPWPDRELGRQRRRGALDEL